MKFATRLKVDGAVPCGGPMPLMLMLRRITLSLVPALSPTKRLQRQRGLVKRQGGAGDMAKVCGRREATAPALSFNALGNAGSLADPANLHIAIEDVPALVVTILFVAAGQFRHGCRARSRSVRVCPPKIFAIARARVSSFPEPCGRRQRAEVG